MRTIKFRCWDKRNKIMYSIAEYDEKNYNVGHFSGLLFDDCADLTTVSFYYEEPDASDRGTYNAKPDEVELMQFTGLLDKNKKEIYEGDIIFEKGQNREVIFHKGCFCVRHFEVDDYPLNRNTYHIFSHEHVEIIGNIYQNPELLPT